MTTTAFGGGYQPPGGPSTTETAKEQAGQVGQTAKEAGSQVASSAAEQTRNVAGEAKNQARNLLNETQGQVREQAGAQKDKAAGGLRSLADELRSMADGTAYGQQSGIATDLARQAAEKAQSAAGWLDSREPGQLLDEIRDLARRKPGTFLLGAAAAGVLAGRLTRGAVDAKRSEESDPTGYDPTSYDRTGYDPTGYDQAGYDPTGYDQTGYDQTDYASTEGRHAADSEGFGADTVVVEPEPYATTPGRGTGGDRL